MPEQSLPPPTEGQPLIEWLNEHYGAEANTLLALGAVWVDRRRAMDGTLLLRASSSVAIRRPARPAVPWSIGAAQICYEDADLIAVDKPVGAYVEATPWDVHTHLRGALVAFLHERDGVLPTLHLVHRLDRDTSGVLLLCKSPELNRVLQVSFDAGRVHKQYLAHCQGNPSFAELLLETGHGRSQHGRFKVYPYEEVGRELANGSRVKSMRTRLTLLRQQQDSALIQAEPLTGRTHQIRLHMAELGHPLLGDETYGGPLLWQGLPLNAHRLRAMRLALPHPRTGAELVIEVAPPEWAA